MNTQNQGPDPRERASRIQAGTFGPGAFRLPAFVIAIAILAGAAWCFAIPPAVGFANEDLARIIVFHLPCAFASTVFLIWAAYLAAGSLRAKTLDWDMRSAAAMELCLMLCVLTMVTGILFSKMQWGAWWQGDPRQWSFLLVLLIVAAYFALRAAFADERKRALHSAAYVAGSILPNLVLIFVLPRIPSLGSFHPSNTIVSGGFSREYWEAILGVFLILLGLTVWLYRLRVRAGLLELALLEKDDANVDAVGGGPAPTGVVRPIAVPGPGGEEG